MKLGSQANLFQQNTSRMSFKYNTVSSNNFLWLILRTICLVLYLILQDYMSCLLTMALSLTLLKKIKEVKDLITALERCVSHWMIYTQEEQPPPSANSVQGFN